jgi:hypothetical protein
VLCHERVVRGRELKIADCFGGLRKMEEPRLPHSGHNQHLCHLVDLGFQERRRKDYKKLVSEPKFVCKKCGRVAKDGRSLCNPRKL